MKPIDRSRLTAALREHVAKIAADLRVKMRVPGPARDRARQLHADEQVGEDFDVWTDILSRRAAVLWVLKSVYIRVLEDRGLLAPGRILDAEAQQLFERLAPNLGETAFLRWIYRDLASPNGGLPELFCPQPAEVTLPSDHLSRALIAFWRHRNPDTGETLSFAEEHFEGELMGDLYQELDPVVKDRFALCQTPDFVRAFILDRTLTPAIETFGADPVRVLDPACGSGHFLIDALKRLVVATSGGHSDWNRRKVVAHCLERVVGIDLNDYACALARARLIMTATELAGMDSLDEAASFHPHVYWADGLEQVERGTDSSGHQLDLLDPTKNEAPRASLSRPELRVALANVLEPRFHAVVANPPYIVEADERRKEYHKEKIGNRPRYVSAFQLAVKNGFVGLITSDSFMKRVFGRPLIEQFLRHVDLTLLVDTSKAEVLQLDSTTVLIFGNNRKPSSDLVRAVMGRRGETEPPTDPARGKVWSSIVGAWNQPGFQNEYITVADLPRELLRTHPWPLSGGGAPQLLEHINTVAARRLSDRATDIGTTMKTGRDEAFVVSQAMARRWDAQNLLPLVRGEGVRDWAVVSSGMVIFPYKGDADEPIDETASTLLLHLWRTKPVLSKRLNYGKTIQDRELKWFEWSMLFRERLRTLRGIAFPVQATHNHFALVRTRAAFNTKGL
jgi:SAM-dependent methyltransferase